MKLGISTASLFGRLPTEDALRFFRDNGIATAEIFLQSFSEYNRSHAKRLIKNAGGIDVHSIHILTTQIEPTLFSLNKVAQDDSFKILKGVLQAGKELKAKAYTFHGGARFKKTPIALNFDRLGEITNRIIDMCEEYGINLAHENVHWGYYNYIGFFKELKKRSPRLKGTLDIKQARQSNLTYKEFIDEMKGDIITVHLSDYKEDGKMCLPGKGVTDFDDLFKRLKDVGFDGGMIVEAYGGDYGDIAELKESIDFLKEKKNKIFD